MLMRLLDLIIYFRIATQIDLHFPMPPAQKPPVPAIGDKKEEASGAAPPPVSKETAAAQEIRKLIWHVHRSFKLGNYHHLLI